MYINALSLYLSLIHTQTHTHKRAPSSAIVVAQVKTLSARAWRLRVCSAWRNDCLLISCHEHHSPRAEEYHHICFVLGRASTVCVCVYLCDVISGCVSYDLSALNEELSAGVGVSVSAGQRWAVVRRVRLYQPKEIRTDFFLKCISYCCILHSWCKIAATLVAKMQLLWLLLFIKNMSPRVKKIKC